MSWTYITVSEWYSYSHWGMYLLPILSAPDWFVDGLHNLDDDQLSWTEAS